MWCSWCWQFLLLYISMPTQDWIPSIPFLYWSGSFYWIVNFKLENLMFMEFMSKYQLSLNGFWTRLLPNTYVNALWNRRSHRRRPDIYISETLSRETSFWSILDQGGLPFEVCSAGSLPRYNSDFCPLVLLIVHNWV